MRDVEPEAVVEGLRRVFRRGVTRPVGWRIAQLEALSRMLVERRDELEDAVLQDLGKAPGETRTTEIALLQLELRHIRRNLYRWLRPRPAAVPLPVQPGRAATVFEPLGVALVIGTWNYPLLLTLSPVAGALAAGDAVVLKPSELAPATSALLAELLPRVLDARAVAVVEGGVDETTGLLEQRFDVILCTGSARVGRVVLEAAAKHLTPVVLELGGKCPAYVDASADLDVVADRIAWGKFMNAGQTCVAPDHVLAGPGVTAALVPRLEAAARRMYGGDPLANEAYCRIVNERQFDRLVPLLTDGAVAFGGRHDRGSRRIEPTVLTGVRDDAEVMQQEVFGPILPILEVAGEAAAIERVAAGPKPLSAYVFSGARDLRRAWTEGTSSGSLVFGVPLLQLAVPTAPFGGVGESGTGSYHGRRSLVAFSHEKTVFAKPTRPDTVRLLAPPFTRAKQAVIDRIAR